MVGGNDQPPGRESPWRCSIAPIPAWRRSVEGLRRDDINLAGWRRHIDRGRRHVDRRRRVVGRRGDPGDNAGQRQNRGWSNPAVLSVMARVMVVRLRRVMAAVMAATIAAMASVVGDGRGGETQRKAEHQADRGDGRFHEENNASSHLWMTSRGTGMTDSCNRRHEGEHRRYRRTHPVRVALNTWQSAGNRHTFPSHQRYPRCSGRCRPAPSMVHDVPRAPVRQLLRSGR